MSSRSARLWPGSRRCQHARSEHGPGPVQRWRTVPGAGAGRRPRARGRGVRRQKGDLARPFAGPQRINDWAAVALVRHFIGLVLGAVAEARYVGGWTLAVGATRLKGRTIVATPSALQTTPLTSEDGEPRLE